MNARVGIDLGGTKIEAVVLDDNGAVLQRRRVKTPDSDYRAIIDAIGRLVDSLALDAAATPHIGIGIPGSISPDTGLVRNANTECLNGQPFKSDLEIRLNCGLRVENDANCLVLSEVMRGVAAGAGSVFGVIIGTGTGGGVCINGELVTGRNAVAGEWGHNPVPWPVAPTQSRPCYCGRENCVETFLCGRGLLRSYQLRGGEGIDSVEGLVISAANGNEKAVATLDCYPQQLAACLATVINILDPELVVLAGGLSNLPDLAQLTERALPRYVFSDHVATRVVSAELGDSSGVFGAACL
ncbi:MAG: ROK family protein [Gammaproteobacteria bacterium]